MGAARVINLANFTPFQAINVLLDPGHIGGKYTVPNGVIWRVHWTLTNGKTAYNVLGANVGGSYTATAAIAESIRAAITSGALWTAYAAFLPTTVSLAAVSIRDMRTLDMPYVQSTGASVPGTSASPGLPDEVAAVASLRTDFVGPANRGRMYLPGFATNALAAGGVIAPATITAANNWLSNIFGSVLGGQGMGWSLIHPPRQAYTGAGGAQHPARSAGLVTVRSVTVRDNHWDTQRRRGLK